METRINRKAVRRRIRYRIRKKVSGTSSRPRLAVFRTSRHIYAQAIDDEQGRTLAHVSTLDASIRGTGGGDDSDAGKVGAAKRVGTILAERLKEAGVKSATFDRGGYVFHGRVKALADAVREAGLKIG